MGGAGSGNWYRWTKKATTNELRSLDVRRWQREGVLRAGYAGRRVWSRDGQETASIVYMVKDMAGMGRPTVVELLYTVPRGRGGQPEDIRYSVPLDWTACHYGGQRPWFICPGVVNGQHCGRRVALLYMGGRYFLCRHCHSLAYESQREDAAGRARIKLQDLRVRLGGSANLLMSFPWKPKRMRWRTYWRMREHADYLEEVYHAGFIELMARFDQRITHAQQRDQANRHRLSKVGGAARQR